MQCFPIRGIFCHSCYFPNQLLSKNSCKRLRQSKETYKVLILVTPTMKLQDIWITPIWHKIRSNRLLWYKIFKPATKSFLLAIGEGMYFYFLLTMKVKSAPLLMGQNAYAEKGGLPHSSNGRLLELLEFLFLSSQETFSLRNSKRHTLPLQRSKKHERAREMREGKWQNCNHETRVYSGNSDHESCNSSSPWREEGLEKKLDKIPPDQWVKHWRCHLCLHLHDQILEIWTVYHSKLGPPGTCKTQQALQGQRISNP